ncbi:MAG: cytochrome-c peroxidase, partial [Chitinophagaceae bacterium]
MKRTHIIVLCWMGLFVLACKKNEALINKVDEFLGFNKPKNFPEPVYNFANNNLTKQGFLLGRALFY